MDEQTRLLRDVREMVFAQGATLDAVNKKLDRHIDADERKFKDLYARHEKHDEFKARVKGGFGVVGSLGVLVGLVGAVKGWFS